MSKIMKGFKILNDAALRIKNLLAIRLFAYAVIEE